MDSGKLVFTKEMKKKKTLGATQIFLGVAIFSQKKVQKKWWEARICATQLQGPFMKNGRILRFFKVKSSKDNLLIFYFLFLLYTMTEDQSDASQGTEPRGPSGATTTPQITF